MTDLADLVKTLRDYADDDDYYGPPPLDQQRFREAADLLEIMDAVCRELEAYFDGGPWSTEAFHAWKTVRDGGGSV